MVLLTNDELFELAMIYSICNRNNAETAREFGRRYPYLPEISRTFVYRMMRRLRTTGSFNPRPGPGRNILYNEDQEIDIIAYFSSNPRSSIRKTSAITGLPRTSIDRILEKHNWHPFCIHGLQALHPSDFNRRVAFSNWLLIQQDTDSNFVKNIMWTDECLFTENGHINAHNDHYWNDTKPSFVQEIHHQRKFSVSVWCGIWNGKLIGPVFYEGTLTAIKYLQLILNGIVTDTLETTPLSLVKKMYFQQDGAPAHKAINVTNWLNENFNKQWIGLNGPTEWPPRSPDLTPLDFYFWGRLRTLVYNTRPLNVTDLKQKIINACNNITGGELQNIYRSIIRRAQLCIGVDGKHFENAL